MELRGTPKERVSVTNSKMYGSSPCTTAHNAHKGVWIPQHSNLKEREHLNKRDPLESGGTIKLFYIKLFYTECGSSLVPWYETSGLKILSPKIWSSTKTITSTETIKFFFPRFKVETFNFYLPINFTRLSIWFFFSPVSARLITRRPRFSSFFKSVFFLKGLRPYLVYGLSSS